MKPHALIPYLDASLNWFIVEEIVIACAEMAVRVIGIAQALVQLVQPPAVILQVLLVLAVDGLELPIYCILEEERGDEELGEAI
jgi:hypothetical protein